MYLNGRGVKTDAAEAGKWFRMAADAGNARCQELLAAMYAEGRGVPQDAAESEKWLKLAVAQGRTEAARLLAQKNPKPIAPGIPYFWWKKPKLSAEEEAQLATQALHKGVNATISEWFDEPAPRVRTRRQTFWSAAIWASSISLFIFLWAHVPEISDYRLRRFAAKCFAIVVVVAVVSGGSYCVARWRSRRWLRQIILARNGALDGPDRPTGTAGLR